VKNLLPIGRFSTVCRLTVKALRHYDELGLLQPAVVDPESGYRYYSLTQASEAERIRALREIDMPLEEIRALLRERDSAAARERLERHRGRLAAQLADQQRALVLLERLIHQQEGAMTYDVTVKTLEPQHLLSIRTRTSLREISATVGRAYGELFGYLARVGVRPAGPPLIIYHDPEFREEDMDVEIGVPIERRLQGDVGMSGGELSGGPGASTIHVGPYNEIGPAYQALAAWIQQQGHETAGAPREIYLVGPEQSRDPAGLRTEIAWPIR
jgi:effector-binding domain-containing protein